MAIDDIGHIIFVQLLQMTQYPGSPFTGDIVRDLIMFLLVPSVFIILLIYMILGRLFDVTPGAQMKLRLLVGITIYLFIIAGGYYRAFALLAGPYFLFLIFILGLFYFIFGHFGVQRGAGPYREGGAFRLEKPNENLINKLLKVGTLNPIERDELEGEYKLVKAQIEAIERIAPYGGDIDTRHLAELIGLRNVIEKRLYGKARSK